MAVPSKKSVFDYAHAMRVLRGRVTFDYRAPFTPAQKGVIRRTFKTASRNNLSRYIPIRKKRGESIAQHKRRIKQLKRKYGQKNNSLKGLFIDIPKGARYRITDNGIHIYKPAATFQELYVPFEPGLLASGDDDVIYDTIYLLVRDHHANGWTRVHILVGSWRTAHHDTEFPETVANEVLRLMSEYPNAGDFINGLIFARGHRPPRPVRKTKPIIRATKKGNRNVNSTKTKRRPKK